MELIGMTYAWIRATFLLSLMPILPIMPRFLVRRLGRIR